ncbi:MBL fold metallo-hydrolase [Stutzerimonas urumqiensis]
MPRLNLKRFAPLAATAALAALVGPVMPAVYAAAPAQQTVQVPGFYHLALGDAQVTALYDGYVDLKPELLKGVTAEDLQSLLAKMFLDSSKGVQTAVNAFLVNTGDNLVLVDTGAASCFGPTLGVIQDNLKAAGYRAEQVDSVLLTHLHADHACGLLDAAGKPAFPNATVYVPHAEAAHWLDPDVAAKAPKEARGFFERAQTAVEPYRADSRLVMFKPGDSLVGGITAVPLIGHTPGHTGYLVESGGKSLLLWGDVIHSHAVQFARPEVAIEFDVDSAKAIESRKKVLADAAQDKLLIGGAHLPFPGLGHVRQDGEGYAWVPVEYGPLRTDR